MFELLQRTFFGNEIKVDTFNKDLHFSAFQRLLSKEKAISVQYIVVLLCCCCCCF